jgi:hypothetical protein
MEQATARDAQIAQPNESPTDNPGGPHHDVMHGDHVVEAASQESTDRAREARDAQQAANVHAESASANVTPPPLPIADFEPDRRAGFSPHIPNPATPFRTVQRELPYARPTPTRSQPEPRAPRDFEQTIGLKWAGWIGAIVLVIGASSLADTVAIFSDAPFKEGELEIRQIFETADYEPVIKTDQGRALLAAEDEFRQGSTTA